MNRPSTPHIEISQNSRDQNESEKILKNFSNFMKQVIDKQNDTFLNGEKNFVKYILAKYLQVPYEDISSMRKISIKINNDYGLLNQFGQFLPQLLLLKLNDSNIITMNNLGTSFTQLVCLQMNKCHLRDLSGIICLQNLKILDVKYNEISDLIELEMSNLKKINLNSNLIADFDNLTFLSGMDDLEWVNLDNNPISKKSQYREQLKKYLPQVEKIDLDEDIVSMYDTDGFDEAKRELFDNKAKGFISSNKKEDERIVNELNKVFESNYDDDNDNGNDDKEILSPKSERKGKSFRHCQCIAHMNQNQPNIHDSEIEEEKVSSTKMKTPQRISNNIFKKQVTKYQIDANDALNSNNNTLIRSCKDNRDNPINKERDINREKEFVKDNTIINILNNTAKSQIKRGNSLNSLAKIEKENYSITAKALLQSINTTNKDKNYHPINPLKQNKGGVDGGRGLKKLLLNKE